MRRHAAPPTDDVKPPLAGRIAVFGGLREAVDLSEQLESRGYLIKRTLTLEGATTAAIDRDCGTVLVLVDRGDEAAALALCRRLGAQNRWSVVVAYGGACGKFVIRALEDGADDCVRSPINPRELVARLRSAARRRKIAARPTPSEEFGDFVLDHLSLRICAPGRPPINLSQTQMRLLAALARRRGEVLSREVLLGHAFGDSSEAFDRAIDTQICRLRKRLAPAGLEHLLRAVPGAGYRLAERRPAEGADIRTSAEPAA